MPETLDKTAIFVYFSVFDPYTLQPRKSGP